DAQNDYMRVILKNIEVEVQVGLHPWEKHPERPTRLLVNVELFTRSLKPGEFIDYDRIRDYLKSWRQRPHTPLLEALAEDLMNVAMQDPHVRAARVSLLKPDIFNEAEGAGIELYRVR